jgi:hypothetical protein
MDDPLAALLGTSGWYAVGFFQVNRNVLSDSSRLRDPRTFQHRCDFVGRGFQRLMAVADPHGLDYVSCDVFL